MWSVCGRYVFGEGGISRSVCGRYVVNQWTSLYLPLFYHIINIKANAVNMVEVAFGKDHNIIITQIIRISVVRMSSWRLYSQDKSKAFWAFDPPLQKNWLILCFTSSAWVSSLGMSALYLFAPVSTTLCQRYGCRVVTIIGGLLCISGLVASSFCTSLPPLYFTYGLVWGLGESLCYFSAFLIIPKYFRAHIALAYGIITCGGAIGGISLSPLTQLLFSSMSVANTFRALAVLYVPVILSSLVFRPVKTNVAAIKHRMFDWTILQNKGYLVYALSTSMFMFGYLVPFVHLVRSSLLYVWLV